MLVLEDNLNLFLSETSFLNYNHHLFDEYLKDIDVNKDTKNLAIELYNKVRDGFIYDPFHLDLRESALEASTILTKKRAWCVEKAILLATVARRCKIPSRLGYAIVINHLGVEILEKYLHRKEIVFHGYVELFIEGRWIKCTPSFDANVCRIIGVPTLDWDGENDSLFQAKQGNQVFMEYVHDYGVFPDVPIDKMNAEMKLYYPHLFEKQYDTKQFSFFHKDNVL